MLATLRALQFAALLGDLLHKTDVYVACQEFAEEVSCRFSNYQQASYLECCHPEMIPEGNWNEHSLGTFFEYYYYSNLTFRFEYLRILPDCSAKCEALGVCRFS